MKTVYGIRIDKELQEEMEKYDVKWNEEIEHKGEDPGAQEVGGVEEDRRNPVRNT